ncbi:MAG: Tim44 domain-containing protein [Rickettsiales bacterium]|nr:Tim44 domain-containing protein [Rickettsiales bacterium]
MMYIFLLLVVTILVFRVLFRKFGFTTTQDAMEKDEAIRRFIKEIDGNEVKGYSNESGGEDIKFFREIYSNYSKKNKTEKGKVNIFDDEIFLKLSEKAIVSILDAFSRNDMQTLKELLSPEMYSVFEKNILKNKQNDMFCKTVIVSIVDKKILNKTIGGGYNSISLLVDTQQINYIENSNGEVISGSKNRINKVKEVWNFVKTDNDNYWLLNSIE